MHYYSSTSVFSFDSLFCLSLPNALHTHSTFIMYSQSAQECVGLDRWYVIDVHLTLIRFFALSCWGGTNKTFSSKCLPPLPHPEEGTCHLLEIQTDSRATEQTGACISQTNWVNEALFLASVPGSINVLRLSESQVFWEMQVTVSKKCSDPFSAEKLIQLSSSN